jgi:hypothetical protein
MAPAVEKPNGSTSEIQPQSPDLSSESSVRGLDDNYEIYKKQQDVVYDEGEVKRVLKKIDYRIVPILFMSYLLQYLDKNALNFASVYGLKAGTHINGSQYSWLCKLSIPMQRISN